MKEAIKNTIVIGLIVSLCFVALGIVFLIISCDGSCSSDVHGGMLTWVCPKFFFPKSSSIEIITIGSICAIITVAFLLLLIIQQKYFLRKKLTEKTNNLFWASASIILSTMFVIVCILCENIISTRWVLAVGSAFVRLFQILFFVISVSFFVLTIHLLLKIKTKPKQLNSN